MEENEESIIDYIKQLDKNEEIKSINTFIKDNVWIVPIMYIIGNIGLLARNSLYQLPFSTISITQLSVIFTYVTSFYFFYYIVKSIMVSIKKLMKRYKKKIKVVMLLILILFIVYALITILMTFFTQNLIVSLIYVILLFTLLNGYELYIKKYGILYDFVLLCTFSIIVLEIPISRGGFKGQKVIFHDSSTNQEKEYTYYGTNENLYQFTDEENVYLISTEEGYIKYKYIEK